MCKIMDDSTNVLSSVWENGKIIKPNTLYNLKKSKTLVNCLKKLLMSCNKSKGSFIGRVLRQYLNSHIQCSNMYSTIIYGKGRKRKFHQSRGNSGTKTEWGTRRQIPTKYNIT